MKATSEQVFRDLRAGTRILRTSPGLSVTAIVLIALVVGGNTTIYSMVNGLLTRPTPGVDGAGLVMFGLQGRPGALGFSYPDYLDYATQSQSLQSIAAVEFQRVALGTSDGTYSANATIVSSNYFDTIRVRPARGRTFTAGDSAPNANDLGVVLSERLWRERFGLTEHIVDQHIWVNGYPATVIGVAPPRFRGTGMSEFADVWLPLLPYSRTAMARPTWADLQDPAAASVTMIGRLSPGASLPRARAECATLFARLERASPAIERDRPLIAPYSAMSGAGLPELAPRFMAIFSLVTLLTLAIVCANVANLMLVRAAARQRETAVRQSLGASRARIVRLLIAEGLVLSVVAWAAACLFTLVVARLLPMLLPLSAQGDTFPVDFTPDWRVLAYAMTLAVLATMAFTLAPGIRTWRQSVLPWLKAGDHGVAQGRSRLSSALVVVQLAFAVLLLTGAGLVLRSQALMTADLGFRPDDMLLIAVNTFARTSTRAENLALVDRMRERLAAVPGVSVASYARVTPRFLSGGRESVRATAAGEPVLTRTQVVGPQYLGVFGQGVLQGRELSTTDRGRGTPAAVINSNLAEALWPGEPAVGHTLLLGSSRQPVEIVGVAPSIFYAGFNPEQPERRPNFLFVAEREGFLAGYREDPARPGETVFYLKYSGTLEAGARVVADAIHDVDAQVPIVSMRPMEQQLADLTHTARILAVLLTYFAAGSLLVAALGQYAVSRFNMQRRTRDFGVRLALGASSSQILGAVLREGVVLTAAGLASGFALSAAVAHAARGALFGVTPTDGRTYFSVFALLGMVSLLASYLPARRASRVDPVLALRHE